MRYAIALICLSLMVSCKSKAVLAEGKATEALTSENIISNHYQNKKDFKTAYIKADARYEDAKQTQNVSAEIRIEKDKRILVSIRFLGITMAKALITPSEVKYYEKINGEYFEGDYTTLSRWLGTDLDFTKVQNMLIGQAMDQLENGQYQTTIEDKLYKLYDASASAQKSFYFESRRFLLMRQEIAQADKDRRLIVDYPNHSEYAQAVMPSGIVIAALQKKGKTDINIQYKSVAFNEELSFPYSVPDGYERIFID